MLDRFPGTTVALTPGRQRLVLALLWIAFFTAYLDRTGIAVAGPTIVANLGLTTEQFGYVLSAFTAGYALMQIPGGVLADLFGAKRMLVIALFLWSAFTGLTGVTASLGALIVVRFLFGVGEGVENGAHFKALADTFASRERSSASGILHTGIALGPALVGPLASGIIAFAGWHALFAFLAVPGVLVAVLVGTCYPSGIEPVREAAEPGDVGAPRTPTFAFAGARTALAAAAYLLFNIAFWGFLGWMPTYLSSARHIELHALGAVSSVPYLFGLAGLLAIGFLTRGPLAATRPLVVAACYLLSGLGLSVAFRAHDTLQSLAGLSFAAFFLYGTFGPFWAVVLDGVPAKARGTFATCVNFGGQAGGFVAPIAVGRIVHLTGSFDGGFAFMAGAVALAAAVMAPLSLRALRAPS